MLVDQINKNNLHHAYLIEGVREEIIPSLFSVFEEIGVETKGNPDFFYMNIDTIKIDDARLIRSQNNEKSFSDSKKVVVVSSDNILLEAQNTLLKVFEEPKPNTHFFIILPRVDHLLPTLLSRSLIIKESSKLDEEIEQAKIFTELSYKQRLEFVKKITAESKQVGEETVRLKAFKFLAALESVLHRETNDRSGWHRNVFEQIWKAREFINQPGSSIKNLLESVALVIPKF